MAIAATVNQYIAAVGNLLHAVTALGTLDTVYFRVIFHVRPPEIAVSRFN
jgi:hypothetical protein